MARSTSDASKPRTRKAMATAPVATAAEPTPAAEPAPAPAPEAAPAAEPAAAEAPATEAAATEAAAEDTCPHNIAKADCPLCEMDGPSDPDAVAAAAASTTEPEPEPAPAAEPVKAVDDDEWDAFAASAPKELDLPLDEGEEIAAQRTDEFGDLIVVTSFGRKLGISPDGWIAVLTGPDIAVRVPPVPKPPRKSWKDQRR